MTRYQRITKEVEVRIFPDNGPQQGEISRWIKENGGDCRLYDGMCEHDVETSTNANWRWKSISIIGQYKFAQIGDYIVKDVDGVFRSFNEQEFKANFCISDHEVMQ